MTNKRLVEKKLEEIAKQIVHLKEIAKLSQKELFGEARNQYFAERVIERLISAAIDINMHIISDDLNEIAENYFDSFILLTKLDVFSEEFARKIAPSASLRNIVVHSYQNIDLDKFFKSIKLAHDQYSEYLKCIQEYLGN